MLSKAMRCPMLLGAALLLAALPAGAQDVSTSATYKCHSNGRVVYTQVPCAGGEIIGSGAPRRADKHREPPQDRAFLARRAQLPAETRKQCGELDALLKEQQAELKAKGSAATLQDETPLVKSKLRYRELKC